jgi:hypothetical protein
MNVPTRLKSRMVSTTSPHFTSEYPMLRRRGKCWRRAMTTVSADPSGRGISPTIRSVEPQSSRRTAVPSPEGDGTPALISACIRLVARKWIQSLERCKHPQASATSPLVVTPVGVSHGSLPSSRMSLQLWHCPRPKSQYAVHGRTDHESNVPHREEKRSNLQRKTEIYSAAK